jgi:hypothetical protein
MENPDQSAHEPRGAAVVGEPSRKRAATTLDIFNVIAEPLRREILVLLRAGERPVTELARSWG